MQRGAASSCARASAARRRLPAGHARPAEVPAAARERVLRERVERAAARRGHGRARHAADRRGFFTGKNGAMLVERAAVPGDAAVLDRGQERFNIYCTPCHDRTGSGNGMVVQRGYPPAAVVPHRPAAADRGRLLLRRHDQRLRRDAGLPGADFAARSLEHRRLHPRAAAEPARDRRPTCRAANRRSSRQPAADGRAPARALTHHDRIMATHAVITDVSGAGAPPAAGARSSASSGLARAARRRRHEPRPVPPVVADRLPVLPRPDARVAGAADAAAPVRRPVGAGRPAHLRSGDANLPSWRCCSSRLLFSLPVLFDWARPEAVGQRRSSRRRRRT